MELREHVERDLPVVLQPVSAEQAYAMKKLHGQAAVFAAGTTLLRTQWESGAAKQPRYLIDLGLLPYAREVRSEQNGLVIGAQTTLSTIMQMDTLINEQFPALIAAIRSIAAPSIRNLATIGGNVLSVVGDSITALLLYDAVLIWQEGQGESEQPLSEWLLNPSGYGLANERVLLRIFLPTLIEPSEERAASTANNLSEPPEGRVDSTVNHSLKRFDRFHKVGRREAFTASLVTAAVNGLIDEHGTLAAIRIAAGGGQCIPSRLFEAENKLLGRIVDEELLQQLYEDIISMYEPRGDVFASALYRKRTAANLIVNELWNLAKNC